jgi:hypothetical protein
VVAFASVEGGGKGGLSRLVVRVPANPYIPIEYLPSLRDPWHAYLRPFHRLLFRGKPEIGSVNYVLLSPARNLPLVVLGAWVLSEGSKAPSVLGQWIRPRRLIHFPGFGKGSTEHPVSGKKISFWHHITFEETTRGNLSSHPSADLDESGHKQKAFPTAPLRFKNAYGRHLGTAIIRQPQDLDLAGLAVMQFSIQPHLRSSSKVEDWIQKSMKREHALVELHSATQWTSDSYLRVNYALIRGNLEDKEYPIGWKFDSSLVAKAFEQYQALPENYPENLTKVPLVGHLSVLVATSILRGRPRWGTLWISPKSR